ncbi:MAG: hypothetical protein CL466_10220 [Acidimicrobiaceae bacterium]|nr:hypothetical protein [Acidimicrobiaceae bacterium]
MADLPKLERLLDLIAVLLNARFPLSLQEIFDELPPEAYHADRNFDSARMKFIRDKDELADLGVIVEDGVSPTTDVWGYTIDPVSFGMELPALDPSESAAVALALAVMGDDVASWEVVVDPVDPAPALIPSAHIPSDRSVEALLDAVTNRTSVAFRYRGEDRVVHPHQAAFVKGNWQVTGFDELRGEIRQFRRDRIDGEVMGTGRSFEPPENPRTVISDHIWRTGPGEPKEIRVAVDHRHASWVEGFLGSTAVSERRDDGSLVVLEWVHDQEAFRGFLLTLLDGAEVLSPESFRRDFVAWLEDLR